LQMMSVAEHIAHHRRGIYQCDKVDGLHVKTCKMCSVLKPMTDFKVNGYSRTGTKTYKPVCSACYRAHCKPTRRLKSAA
jgi:roadblock/LC7 domain-containing protein